MDEFDSGGRGSDRGVEAEDEGSTTPLPEKVSVICLSWKKCGIFLICLHLMKCCCIILILLSYSISGWR